MSTQRQRVATVPACLTTTPAMRDRVFRAFQTIALEMSGIEVADSKRAMIATRFSRRLSALGLDNFEDYLDRVRPVDSPERSHFIDTVTTNLTYFFREPHHFDYLTQLLVDTGRFSDLDSVRIWSAGCSSGQEAYSLAITLSESEALHRCRAKILCTDIHSVMIRQTEQGLYRPDELRGLSDARIHRWSQPSVNGLRQMDDRLRRLLIPKHLNLFDRWPVRAGVDIIFCRNVLIYFDRLCQQRILRGFAAAQARGAHLFLGHSENIRGCEDVYRRVENTVYERR